MVNQPTAKDRLIDRRSVLQTGAALAPAPRLMAGRQRRLGANSWSVPEACERAKDSRFRETWRSAHVVVCSTHFGIDVAEPLARRRCCRRLSCAHPYSVFFRGRARRGFHSPTWVPRFWVERELLGLWARPPAGFGSRANDNDPNYPYTSECQNGRCIALVEPSTRPPIVNTNDPILKPWAAKQMQATNEEVLSGKMAIPFTSQSRCWPGGVPGQLLFLQPMYFLQTPKQVWMIWERDHFARRIYLTDKHSEHVKPSWFGESIGHYEGGDTLVVDTIGLAGGKNHYIDSFRTPHTEKLHVVERFTISQDGRSLTAIVTVEDPETFNGPLTLKQTWRKNQVAMAETVCAENVDDHFNENLHPFRRPTKRISDAEASGRAGEADI